MLKKLLNSCELGLILGLINTIFWLSFIVLTAIR